MDLDALRPRSPYKVLHHSTTFDLISSILMFHIIRITGANPNSPSQHHEIQDLVSEHDIIQDIS